jgi:hypothetical protein
MGSARSLEVGSRAPGTRSGNGVCFNEGQRCMPRSLSLSASLPPSLSLPRSLAPLPPSLARGKRIFLFRVRIQKLVRVVSNLWAIQSVPIWALSSKIHDPFAPSLSEQGWTRWSWIILARQSPPTSTARSNRQFQAWGFVPGYAGFRHWVHLLPVSLAIHYGRVLRGS